MRKAFPSSGEKRRKTRMFVARIHESCRLMNEPLPPPFPVPLVLVRRCLELSRAHQRNPSWNSFKKKYRYNQSKTKEFDDIAVSHLMYLIAPLMVGYAAYSLMHHQHKGWYSWVLNSLVGFVYMFGFVNMTPQLFINYKVRVLPALLSGVSCFLRCVRVACNRRI